MSTYGTSPRHHASTTAFSTPASTTLFRRLTWEGTVPLEIRVDSKELPANSDRGLEYYYIQAPRVSYLPLIMPEIKRYLMDVVFDESAGTILRDDDWWFESEEGALLKWHWPIGLIYDNHIISTSVRPQATWNEGSPLRMVLHLVSPPNDRLLLSPSAEACKQAFMGQMKEADFIRWGNTKRMTSLRKADQDGIWEGIKEHNFDEYWRVASKVTPTTAPVRPQSPALAPNASVLGRPPSTDPAGAPNLDGAYSVRSVPVRVYLPDGPVIQELVPPMLEEGIPNTLGYFLSSSLPLLFPPQDPVPAPSTAYALIQGVLTPPEAEVAWLGACMAGADGWVNVCVGLTKN